VRSSNCRCGCGPKHEATQNFRAFRRYGPKTGIRTENMASDEIDPISSELPEGGNGLRRLSSNQQKVEGQEGGWGRSSWRHGVSNLQSPLSREKSPPGWTAGLEARPGFLLPERTSICSLTLNNFYGPVIFTQVLKAHNDIPCPNLQYSCSASGL